MTQGPILAAGLGRLHFAGEHTCLKFVGFMEGAVQSGRDGRDGGTCTALSRAELDATSFCTDRAIVDGGLFCSLRSRPVAGYLCCLSAINGSGGPRNHGLATSDRTRMLPRIIA